MRIVVTSGGRDLDSPASPVFGRCHFYVFVDTHTWQFEAFDNPAISAAGGAGIQAAQFVVAQGAQAILSGHIGPNAFQVFRAASLPVYLLRSEGTVRQAIEDYQAGRLTTSDDAKVTAHASLGRGKPRGMGGRDGGPRRALGIDKAAPPAAAGRTSRQHEIDGLLQMTSDLRQQMADVMDRIDKLEAGV